MIELLTSPSVATLIAALAFAVRGVPRILEARAKAAEARARTAQARAEQGGLKVNFALPELMFVNRLPTAAEITSARAYLVGKWGATP